MNLFFLLAIFFGGFFVGIAVALILRLIQAKTAQELANEIYRTSEIQQQQNLEYVLNHLKSNFGEISFRALKNSTDEFLKLARSRLESEREVTAQELEKKKSLIDQQLQQMNEELQKVANLMAELEKDRVEKFSQLESQLKTASEQTAALIQTTNSLKEALSSSKARGQWGERMAEDVLRLAGFVENVNYLRQKAIRGVGSKPDFTFLLPKNLKLNMDVKFPLDNYLRYLEANTDFEKENFKRAFLKDVKARIKEVTTRDYINPEQNTVDYVLLFIPNEQIYAFIHEADSTILDEGIRNRVIFCSPITLFAILAVIRQAVENFALEKTSNKILSLMAIFKKQWTEFILRFENLGKKIQDVQKEYEILTTRRRRQLERPLNEIEALQQQGELMAAQPELKLNPPDKSEDSAKNVQNKK